MSLIRVGSNSTYADGWSNVFGKVKSAPKSKVSAAKTKTKSAKPKAAKKKPRR